VLVTRAAGRAAELSALLRSRGAIPIEAPAITVAGAPEPERLDDAVLEAAAGAFDWVVFTSGAGVEAWFGRADAVVAGPPRARVAAVGPGTSEALRSRGVEADLVPPTFTTEALAAAFPSGDGRVLLARADLASSDLEDAIRERGWTPVRVDAYRTDLAEALPSDARDALDDGRVDVVTFTSASTVRGFVRAGGIVRGPRVVCIGPVTADEARRAGFDVDEVADPHTIEGLVAAVERALGRE
jgi:uroporphyrinogen-III synthase